jgi:PAS domain S-box-containing protein
MQPLIQQIYEQRYLLDGIVNHSNCMVFLMDHIGGFQYISPNFHTITGYRVKEALGQSFIPFVHPEDVQICQLAIQQVLVSQQPQTNLEYRVQHNDGSFHWHCANLMLLPTANGGTQILGLTLDIDDRRCAEDELKANQAKFQRFADNVPGMLYQFQMMPTGESQFLYVNDFCEKYFGVSPTALVNQQNLLYTHLHPDDIALFEQSIVESMLTLRPWDIEWRTLNLANRSIQWFHGRSTPVRQPDGSTIWDGLMTEITDRKTTELALQESQQEMELAMQELQQAQTQLVQSEKMSSLGQVVAGVAHEINNPMSFIYGNLEHAEVYINHLLHLIQLYQSHYPEVPEAIHAYATKIDLEFLLLDLPKLLASMQVGAQRVREIVLNLRNFSRIDEAEIKDVNLHDGIDSTIMILKHRLQRSNGKPKIQLHQEYGAIPPLTCHAGQLNQVFMNILANAIDALDERDEQRTLEEIQAQPSIIRIRTEYEVERRSIKILIRDNGIGIPEKNKAQLFNPFFTTKSVGKGTGMGLAISYQVVAEKHNGQLTCHSAAGEGTEFVIELPLRESASEP